MLCFYHVNEPKVKAREEEAFKRTSALKPKGLFVGDDNASQIDGNSGLMKLISDSEILMTTIRSREKKTVLLTVIHKRVMSSTMFEHYSNYVMNKFKTATDEITTAIHSLIRLILMADCRAVL